MRWMRTGNIAYTDANSINKNTAADKQNRSFTL